MELFYPPHCFRYESPKIIHQKIKRTESFMNFDNRSEFCDGICAFFESAINGFCVIFLAGKYTKSLKNEMRI